MTSKTEIRLEDLVGTRVRDRDGRVVGRIREIEAEWHGNQCVVTSLHLGKGERLPLSAVDLSDPKTPRLRA
jgi:sporulation protein YlmC with PRC-barrel domain